MDMFPPSTQSFIFPVLDKERDRKAGKLTKFSNSEYEVRK